MKKSFAKGFTLIELLVVIGIIAILAGVVIVALNPGRQFSQARNTQRWSNVNTILNAVSQNMADNKGIWNCTTTMVLPASSTEIGTGSPAANIENCIVPTYVSTMPYDPSSTSTVNTGYAISYNTTTRRITVNVIHPELDEIISVSR